MAKVDGLSMAWDGLLDNLLRVVNDWHPEPYRLEREYSDSLAEFIRKCAPKARVEREYHHLGSKVDVFVEWEGALSKDAVCIELKLNLSSKTAFDRLIGQIEQLEPRDNQVMIVLCGNTNTSLLDRLKKRYREQMVWPKPTVRIVEKNTTVAAVTQ